MGRLRMAPGGRGRSARLKKFSWAVGDAPGPSGVAGCPEFRNCIQDCRARLRNYLHMHPATVCTASAMASALRA